VARRVAGKKATLTSYPDSDDDTIICAYVFYQGLCCRITFLGDIAVDGSRFRRHARGPGNNSYK
jgi:hypothetical protein